VYSEYREGATNLFKPSALLGGFKYQRSYKFSNGATWSSYHNIKFDPQTKALQGTFMTRDFRWRSSEVAATTSKYEIRSICYLYMIRC
jgi:hypothetical protein